MCEAAEASVYFFFQAEDGIRDYKVTGVQTCALPIYQHGDGRPEPSPHHLPAPSLFTQSRIFGKLHDLSLSGHPPRDTTRPSRNARQSSLVRTHPSYRNVKGRFKSGRHREESSVAPLRIWFATQTSLRVIDFSL